MADEPQQRTRPTPESERRDTRNAGLSYTREDAYSDLVERYRLPALFALILALIGASRFEATRPLEASFIAVAVPVVLLGAGAKPFLDARPELRAAGLGVALGVLALSELRIVGALFPSTASWALLGPPALLWIAGALAILTEALAARAGMRSRLASCAGIAIALAWYLPHHFRDSDAFGTVLAGLLVAVFAGGGSGLLLGALAAKWARGGT
ncbi:MAG TPA: hypothetical protein VI072_20255 [Polyangiaceae bacterium]